MSYPNTSSASTWWNISTMEVLGKPNRGSYCWNPIRRLCMVHFWPDSDKLWSLDTNGDKFAELPKGREDRILNAFENRSGLRIKRGKGMVTTNIRYMRDYACWRWTFPWWYWYNDNFGFMTQASSSIEWLSPAHLYFHCLLSTYSKLDNPPFTKRLGIAFITLHFYKN